MPNFEPLDPGFPLMKQMGIDAGPIVLVNLCTMAPEDEAAFLEAWREDSGVMKRSPGYISTQLHRALGDNPTYLNYAIFDSAAAWRDAFRSAEFQESLKAHPPSLVARPHLFRKVAVPGMCTE